MANKKNLKKPWEKGQSSPNPQGRPKESPKLKGLRKWCRERCSDPDFIKMIEKRARKSDKILELIIHYGAGKPADRIEATVKHDFSNQTDDELRAKLKKMREDNG